APEAVHSDRGNYFMSNDLHDFFYITPSESDNTKVNGVVWKTIQLALKSWSSRLQLETATGYCTERNSLTTMHVNQLYSSL
ncbi:hypothetical protein GJ496_010493, partial [Pomphorhynchus laevis]